MKGVHRAVAFSIAERLFAFLLQFASTIVIARLLNPGEIGIFSLAASVVAIAHVVRQFGIADFLVQEQNVTRDLLRTVYGVTLTISWALAALLLIVSEPAAIFYQEMGVASVLRILALSFFLMPIGSICSSMMVRELSFGRLSIVQTSGTIAATVTSIVLAYRGHSFLSLAWGSVAGAVVTIAAFAVLRPAEIFMLPKFANPGRILRFSTLTTGGYIIDQLGQKIPDFLIPRFLGFEALGLFSRGQSLIQNVLDLLLTGFLRVCKPVFARTEREPAALKVIYLNFLSRLALFPIFLCPFLAIFSEPLVYLFFGKAWLPAAPILSIFSISALLFVPYYMTSAILMGVGQSRELLRIAIIRLAVAITTVSIGVHFGLIVTTILFTIGSLIAVVAYHRALHKLCHITVIDLADACKPSVIAVVPAISLSSLMLSLPLANELDAFQILGLGLLIATFGTGILALYRSHPITLDLSRALKSIKTKYSSKE